MTNIKKRSRLTARKKGLIALSLVIGILLALYGWFGAMTGVVVDAETGKPIEGAVVLVEWLVEKGLPGLTNHKVYKTAEKLTDKNGRFRFYKVLNPLVDQPDITIYKKGYVAWNNNFIFKVGRREDFRWIDGYVYRLERFKPEYSYDDHESHVSRAIHDSLGLEKKHLFMKVYDEGELNEILKERNEKMKRSQQQ